MSDEQKQPKYWQVHQEARNENQWGMNHMPDPRTATPDRLAYEARERGDRLFQIDMVISVTEGWAQMGSAGTRTYRPMEGVDYLGPIEDQGWRLEHVSTAYVEQGSSATKRVMANVGSTEVSVHGYLVGTYVFRRVS